MNVTETPFGLLFKAKQTPKWVELFSIVFILVLFFVIREIIKTYKNKKGRDKNRILIIYSGIVAILLIGISFVFPIHQYNSNYQIGIHYKGPNKEITISCDNALPTYKNPLVQFKGYYIEETISSIKNNSNNSKINYKLYLWRNDGLLLSLGEYQKQELNSLLPKIKQTGLREITNSIYALRNPKDDGPITLKYDYLKINENLINIKPSAKPAYTEITYPLKANSIVTKSSIIILILLWLFVFSQATSNHPGKKVFYLGIPLSLIFTSIVILYNLSYLNATQHIRFSKNGYTSYSYAKLLGVFQFNEGKWKNAKMINAVIGANEKTGIVISENDLSLNKTILSNAFNAALNGKYKYIRTESLDEYNQIILADYVLSITQKMNK